MIALLCAGFACTQDVFVSVVDWLGALSLKLNYGWFTAFFTGLMMVWCGYKLKNNWQKYRYSDILIATLVFYVITTLYYRFIYNGYDYVPLLWKVTYVDVLWGLAIAFVIESLINKKKVKGDAPGRTESSILLDYPIETPEEDKFDYYTEAKHIADTLSKLPEDNAVSVAVLSPWGYGKTSFVNLIKYAIKHGDNDKPLFDHVIIEFNPRQSKDVSSIQEDFFKALIETIPNEFAIRSKVSDYLENIGIQEIHPVAKIFTGIIKRSKDDVTRDVNSALDSLGKRLVVFIDDFDRLTDVEIIETLKLIDKNAAFRHTVFITAYDENAVSSALKNYESDNGIAYIDKFFTLRFHLPLRSEHSVVNSVYQTLKEWVNGEKDLLPIMNKQYWVVAECVRSLRDVKNFCNMFMMDYVFNTKQDVDFGEYLLLELMKFGYYEDYCNLYKKVYVENRSLFQNADALYSLKAQYSTDKQGKEPEGNLPRSIRILRSIFADYKSFDDYGCSKEKPTYRSVQYVRYFDMYFTNRGYGHVQAERLESLYTMQSDDEIDKFYRQCIQQKAQSDIVDFLRYQDWQDITPKGGLTKEETFKQFVRLVFLYSAVTNDDDMHIHSLQLQLIYKTNFEEKGYNGLEEGTYHDYLMNILYREDTTYIPLAFLMRITHTLISPESDGVKEINNFILMSDEVKRKNLELFKKYIGTQQQYTTYLSSVYRLCMEHIDNSRVIISKEANDIMRDFLNKDKSNEYLNEFLIFNKESDYNIIMGFKDPFFKQIFPVDGDKDLFEIYVKKSLPKGDENRAEILAYLKRYRKAGSDHSGYYIVKNDNPNPSNKEIIEGLVF
ncbi:KAP family P-loop domain-containing protein [Prevotella communis]|uniref:KAP family P-loop domain-containing protein n=2 Tax=Prevotella communis TaxID=2913614 RepID=A0A1H0KYD9_9BACT|nr:KAP family P-loop domain-containing protein [Prevotella communis]